MKRCDNFYCLFVFLIAFLITLPLHAQLADSPWPMFLHNSRHTGRTNYKGPKEPIFSWSFKLRDISYALAQRNA